MEKKVQRTKQGATTTQVTSKTCSNEKEMSGSLASYASRHIIGAVTFDHTSTTKKLILLLLIPLPPPTLHAQRVAVVVW